MEKFHLLRCAGILGVSLATLTSAVARHELQLPSAKLIDRHAAELIKPDGSPLFGNLLRGEIIRAMFPGIGAALFLQTQVVPQTIQFTTNGVTNWTVLGFNTLVLELNGAGGGGYASTGTPGAGGNTNIGSLTLLANGGSPGALTSAGAGGTASGGDTNTTGNASTNSTNSTGGTSPNAPGTSGQGGTGQNNGRGGGGGGYCKKTYTAGAAGAPVPGASLTLSVAAGGISNGHPGIDGAITITIS